MIGISGRTALKGQRLLVSIAILAGLFALPGIARADEIALWNFNDANLLVDRGAGTLTTTATPTDVIFSTGMNQGAQMGDPAGFSLAIQGGLRNQNNGSIIDIRVSTVGFDSIGFFVAAQRTSTGFNFVEVQYSNDGINFNTFLSTSPIALEPSEGFFAGTFGPVLGVANNPFFALRLTIDGATSDIGQIRFDNIRVTGTPTAVPEPTTLLLLGTGLFGAVGAARRRIRKA